MTGSDQKRRQAWLCGEGALREPSWLRDVLLQVARNKPATAGITIVIVLAIMAAFAPLVSPYDPMAIEGIDRLRAPSFGHPFGMDHLGRDVLSRVIYGARVSLFVGVTSVAMGLTLGTILGLIAGYFGGWVDSVICRILDVFFGIPTLLLAIALSAVLGTGLLNPIAAITIVNIPFFTRMVRGPTLVEKSRDYVTAAITIGAGPGRILRQHILPNLIPVIIVQASLNISYAILIEASLGFVGLGVQPPTPSWGGMLNEGRTYLELAPWTSVFPGLSIMTAILAFNLTGDGLRDALDPTLRGV